MKKHFTLVLSLFLLLGVFVSSNFVHAANNDPVNCEASRNQYLADNLDVKAAGAEPWSHYNSHGYKEGRTWRSDLCSTVVTSVTPKINSISPSIGTVGTMVTINGSGFAVTGNKIKFGNLGSESNPVYSVNSTSGMSLSFKVPESNYYSCWNPVSGPQCNVPAVMTAPGNYEVSVINTNGESNKVTFTVISETQKNSPKITVLSPSSGLVNSQVTIIGEGFMPTGNKIKFGNLGSENNREYILNSQNGTSISFKVPVSNYYSCWNPISGPQCSVPATLTVPGVYEVSVINANGESNKVTYTVLSETQTTPDVSIYSPIRGASYIKGSQQLIKFRYSTIRPFDEPFDTATYQLDQINPQGNYTKVKDLGTSSIAANDVMFEWLVPTDLVVTNTYAISVKITQQTSAGVFKTSNAVHSGIFNVINKEDQLTPAMHITSDKTDKNGNINIKPNDKITITATYKNLGTKQYTTYWYTDKFEIDDCVQSSTIAGNVWSITCRAVKEGVSKFYLSLQQDGKTYNSNILAIVVGDDEISPTDECDEVTFTKTLKIGSRGDEVDELQSILVDLNMMAERYSNGYFGTRTRTALKKFQKQNGILQTGQTDAKTRDVLNAVWKKICLEQDYADGEVLGASIKRTVKKNNSKITNQKKDTIKKTK